MYDIREQEFWEMTISELKRLLEVKQNKEKIQLKQEAIMNYKLAGLIGISFANKLPDIWEVYPSLFDKQEEIEKRERQRAELDTLRFLNFAKSFNKKFAENQKEANK